MGQPWVSPSAQERRLPGKLTCRREINSFGPVINGCQIDAQNRGKQSLKISLLYRHQSLNLGPTLIPDDSKTLNLIKCAKTSHLHRFQGLGDRHVFWGPQFNPLQMPRLAYSFLFYRSCRFWRETTMFAFLDEEPWGPQSVVAQVHFDQAFALVFCDPPRLHHPLRGAFSQARCPCGHKRPNMIVYRSRGDHIFLGLLMSKEASQRP